MNRTTVSALAMSTVVLGALVFSWSVLPAEAATRVQAGSPTSASPASCTSDLSGSTAALLNGLQASCYVGTTRELIDPASNSRVVAVATGVEVGFGGSTFMHLRKIDTPSPDSREPIAYVLSSVTPAMIQPELTGTCPARSYDVAIRPREGKSWGQVRNSGDVILSAQPR